MKTKPKNSSPFELTLISASKIVRLDAAEVAGKKITPKCPGWSVRKLTLHGGKQEGVDVIVVNNGKLTGCILFTSYVL